VGFADDAFDVDVLLKKLEEEAKTNELDREDTDDHSNTDLDGKRGKQFLIFMITTYEKL